MRNMTSRILANAKTHAKVEVHSYVSGVSHLKSSTPHPKFDLEKQEKCNPMNHPMAWVHKKSHKIKNKFEIWQFRRISVEGSGHSEKVSVKKCYAYRSTRPKQS